MRFTLSSTALSSKLFALAKVISNKNSLPILADFMFRTEGNTLFITASDSENSMTTTIELSDSDIDDSFAIENHSLLEAVKSFPEQPLTFEADKNDKIVKIIYQNGQFSLPIESADVYPVAAKIADIAVSIQLSSALLSENISRCLCATAQDELRPIMNGIFFDIDPEGLAVVASDGHKLVRNKLNHVKSENHASFILPKKPANLLKNVLAKNGSEVTVVFDNRNACVTYSGGSLTCRLTEGRYPNYASVIPHDNTNVVNIDRKALLGSIKRVLPFANEATQLIRLRIDRDRIEVSSEDIDFSTSAKEEIVCDYDGIPMSIGFKGSTLTEILNNLDSENVLLKLADPTRAGLFMPETQPEGEDILMLMMPMLLND